jgi:flagellar hook-associated protein 1 FlgK
MSLFSSIRMAANTLQVDQIALQVIGQNIANANTPGYIREETTLTPGPTQKVGNVLLGTGVQVLGVVQKIDKFLEERLRGAVSDKSNTETLSDTYLQLEQLIGETSDNDLSTAMDSFFSSIADILNQPESTSVRNLAVLQGQTLASEVSQLSTRVQSMRRDLNDQVTAMATDINRLVEEIRTLNVRITETEGGGVSNSDAVGLRDQRLTALESLSELIAIRTEEQEDGSISVYCGGDFLISGGISRSVGVVEETDRGMTVSHIHLLEIDSPLDTSSGKYQGLCDARDDVLGGFIDDLDSLAQTLVFEFNKIYSSGQGLTGYSQLTSLGAVVATDEPLDESGLDYTPVNGSFQVLVYNTKTGLTQTSDVQINLTGLGHDTTMDDLVQAMDAIDGISASLTPNMGLSITSDSSDLQFAFAADTSGVLAALGVNTFFTGTSAASMGVNDAVVRDPGRFAASRGGIGIDTENAITLAGFFDLALESQNGDTLADLYDRVIGGVTQGSAVARSEANGASIFEETLRGQKLATSGVSLDEETVQLLAYQKSFQASSRYISALSELLDLLTAL